MDNVIEAGAAAKIITEFVRNNVPPLGLKLGIDGVDGLIVNLYDGLVKDDLVNPPNIVWEAKYNIRISVRFFLQKNSSNRNISLSWSAAVADIETALAFSVLQRQAIEFANIFQIYFDQKIGSRKIV